MWLDKEIIPALINAVEITLKEELEAHGRENFNQKEHYDPNDLIIFDSFVLPVLKEGLGRGVDSAEILDKGFGFLMGLIAWYLRENADKLTNEQFGKLALLHYHYWLDHAKSYLEIGEAKWIKENLERINEIIEIAKLSLK